MKIKLETPKEIVIVPERRITISEIELLEIIDNPKEKTVTVMSNELGMTILWSGMDYINIGQWTNDDVTERIKEIFS
jgi:hypothetical protein